MKTVDYIIVGCGLAGLHFSELLLQKGKSVVVFDDNSQQSSRVASGLYNPVALKRFTAVWNAKQQLDIALPIYSKLEQKQHALFVQPFRVLRRFNSIEEQNNWFVKSDKPGLKEFLNPNIISNTSPQINAPCKLGEVLQAGRVDVAVLLKGFRENLKQKEALYEERFDYNQLEVNSSGLKYKAIDAKAIVFAEGFGVLKNPFFNDLPLRGNKGELLVIHAPELQLNYILKGPVFIIPLGNDFYQVGSTYNREDLNHYPTEAARKHLTAGLKSLINTPFTIHEQKVGIRPVTKDRKPLVGNHKKYSNIYILNGLGSRGVMVAPYIAKQLFNYIEKNIPLDSEINLNRFNASLED